MDLNKMILGQDVEFSFNDKTIVVFYKNKEYKLPITALNYAISFVAFKKVKKKEWTWLEPDYDLTEELLKQENG